MTKLKFSKPNKNSYDGERITFISMDEIGQVSYVKIFSIGKIFYFCHGNKWWWIRLFKGYGIYVKKITKRNITFSERYGYAKGIKLFGCRFKILKPNK
jgi:hypothetical protein